MRFEHAVVAGKFYPPHLGHKYVIDEAAATSQRVTVLLVDTPVQGRDIPALVRASWLAEIHADQNVTIRLMPDIMFDNRSDLWAEYTNEFLDQPIDAVFSSESYGDTWAKELGCTHVKVDAARHHYPVSSTKIMADPYAHWDMMMPVVRAHFVKRVVVVGAESTGKTTLAQALAQHYNTEYVGEFGRDRDEASLEETGALLEWPSEDFRYTALTQRARENRLARQADRVLICDTDELVTALWHERYHGRPDYSTLDLIREHDLYLLCDMLEWDDDGTRSEWMLPDRETMQQRYIEELDRRGFHYITVTGDRDQRRSQAIRAIDELFRRNDET